MNAINIGLNFSVIVLLLVCAWSVGVWGMGRLRAARATTIVEVGSATGDNETTAFKANFQEGTSVEDQKNILDGLYGHIMARRKWSHDAYEQLKKDAIARREAEMAAEEQEQNPNAQVASIRGKPPKGA
jgi:hypothetical protein